MKRVFIWSVIIIPLMVLAFSFLQLGWKQIHLTMEVENGPSHLRIVGQTNLPDKVILTYEIEPAQRSLLQEEGTLATGIVIVQDGVYAVSVDKEFFPDEPLQVWVRFEVYPGGPPQPESIRSRFGSYGERMSGENSRQEAGRKWVEIQKIVQRSDTFPVINNS